MPDSQKPSPQNSGGHNSGAPSTTEVKDKAQQVAGQAKEATQQVAGQAKEATQQVVGQAKEAAKPVLDQAKASAEQLAQQAREHYGNISEGAMKGYRQAEGAVARNPAPAMLISFGVGFGLGVVICSLLAGKKEETWAEKYLPESLQDVPDQYSSLVSQLKGLPKTIQSQLPKSVSKYLS